MKEEALDRTVWRARFGRGFGPVVRQTTTAVLISPQPDQEGNKLGSISGTRAISTTLRRELSSIFFFFLEGRAPKEIHAILTETLTSFLPGRAEGLSAPL